MASDGKDWNSVATVSFPDGSWGLRLLITAEVKTAETYPLRVAIDVGARWVTAELADRRCHKLAALLGFAASPYLDTPLNKVEKGMMGVW